MSLQRKPAASWAALKECCQQDEGGDPCPVCSTGESTSEVLAPLLDSPVHKGQGQTGTSPAKGWIKMIKGLKYVTCE